MGTTERMTAVLQPGEAIDAWAGFVPPGNVTNGNGARYFAVTNRRLLLFNTTLWLGRVSTLDTEFPLEALKNVRTTLRHPVLLVGLSVLEVQVDYGDERLAFTSSGLGVPRGRRFAKALEDRVSGSEPANAAEDR
jgi:hypothetical protein